MKLTLQLMLDNIPALSQYRDKLFKEMTFNVVVWTQYIVNILTLNLKFQLQLLSLLLSSPQPKMNYILQ